MIQPSTKKPTKKAFHFPKTAEAEVQAPAGDESEQPAAIVIADAKATSSKAAKQKSAVKKTAVKKAAPKKAAVKEATPKKAAKQKPAPAEAAVKKPAATAEGKVKREKKEKVVRDSFTMPKSDYQKIAAIKQKCLEAGVSVKKGEILRAGLLLLESAATQRLLAAVSAVETVKTGRPAKS